MSDQLRASIRLQLHSEFGFYEAANKVPYFNQLGISHLYVSPIFKARDKSSYGYDVVDTSIISTELGGEQGLEALVEKLHQFNMGLIVDFVPNHMAVGDGYNPWWLSVMEWGKQSPFASFFDIQWNSTDPLLDGQLLLPVLGTGYGEAITSGTISVNYDEKQGKFFAQHYSHQFPIRPASYFYILNLTQDADLMALGRQFAALNASSDPVAKADSLFSKLARMVEDKKLQPNIFEALNYFSIPDSVKSLPEDEKYLHGPVKRLHNLLEVQHYRLASWQTASDEINWRRFFDINELAAIRIERHEVFEAIHKKLFELIDRGLIDGIRLDHIDGLANPRTYCRKLRRRISGLIAKSDINVSEKFPIYVEKILGNQEQLPVDWEVDGTTGYDFMDQISLLQHDPAGKNLLTKAWAQITGRPETFAEEVKTARELILTHSFTSEFEAVARGLHRIARVNLATRDITFSSIKRVLFALLVNFPVYRTYTTICNRSDQDQLIFSTALKGAANDLNPAEQTLLSMIETWLGGERIRDIPPGPLRKLRRKTLTKFQQLTSPLAAKAMEDTAGYRFGVLISRNDVGFTTENFSSSEEYFHRANIERFQYFPQAMITTATHDHKRGEDVRARLAVISERADWYENKIQYWLRIATELGQDSGEMPSKVDQLFLFQTLLGTWPLSDDDMDVNALNTYLDRLTTWQLKSIREAKLEGSWLSPNEYYEGISKQFLTRLLMDQSASTLQADIVEAAKSISVAGAINSLTQILARLTCPGVPDLYQGNELWDFSLVDPDNRRAVDFNSRIENFNLKPDIKSLITHWKNGEIKQYLIGKILEFRKTIPELFSEGRYIPLRVIGREAHRVTAFARIFNHEICIVILPRLTWSLLKNREYPQIDAELWGNTSICLPESTKVRLVESVLTDEQVSIEDNHLSIASALKNFPVNLMRMIN
jgi:(1->4)-alpha-D-glucan 1-alpha-D-glucosylmutase